MPISSELHVALLGERSADQQLLASLLSQVPHPTFHVEPVTTFDAARQAIADGMHDLYVLTGGGAFDPLALLGPAVASGRPVIVLMGDDDAETEARAIAGDAWAVFVASQLTPSIVRNVARCVIERGGQIRDLLDARQLEEQVRHAQKMEAVGRLAGGVAHDFNNLLTAIVGYAEMLKEEFQDGDPRAMDVGEIQAAAERATTLTKQLLTCSRRQTGQLRVLDLNEIVTGFEHVVRRVLGANIRLEAHLAADLPTVKGDPGQLEQVLMHLALNARDAMPQGGCLTFETSRVMLDEAYAKAHVGVKAGEHARLVVSDEGTGMLPEVLAHAFEPFFTTKEKGKGTGLGLATVYGIVQQSGGHVAVVSEVGKGTTVTIHLPAAR